MFSAQDAVDSSQSRGVVEGGRATTAGPRLASLTDASMAAPQLGSYSSSTALSPRHYKLVHQVEQARTAEVSPSSSSAESPELMRPLRPQDTNRVLLDCLVTMKTSWAKRAPSPVRPSFPSPAHAQAPSADPSGGRPHAEHSPPRPRSRPLRALAASTTSCTASGPGRRGALRGGLGATGRRQARRRRWPGRPHQSQPRCVLSLVLVSSSIC